LKNKIKIFYEAEKIKQIKNQKNPKQKTKQQQSKNQNGD